jgi:hypothetical protein
MKAGDLVQTIRTGAIGIVMKVIGINAELYCWVYTTIQDEKYEEVLLHESSLKKL